MSFRPSPASGPRIRHVPVSNGSAPTRIAQLTATYLVADFRWELDGVWRGLEIGRHAPEPEAAFPDAPRFGLMSAANPGLYARTDIDNRSADRALQRRMDALGLHYRPAFVAAANRVWKTYNWLIVGPEVEIFDVLSREFGQIGTLLWSRGEAVRLRMDAVAPDEVATHPFIDWIGIASAGQVLAGGMSRGESNTPRSP